ncbi:Cables2 protein [Capsaspora owczarzaki ATCC 30864]|uniref:Cables2 protein n=1 Tax=Capsaspora owczarzaki (strain ATCC 30864) TaxID=595528 RepID=UPI0001FE4E8A|nr:Cables2 protein [Capsaspora owczarzaki ATCC 30864]|eukprot:XP_004365319.1 Cables2 protein [Capsaspora owczarzaki ATCC 30864]
MRQSQGRRAAAFSFLSGINLQGPTTKSAEQPADPREPGKGGNNFAATTTGSSLAASSAHGPLGGAADPGALLFGVRATDASQKGPAARTTPLASDLFGAGTTTSSSSGSSTGTTMVLAPRGSTNGVPDTVYDPDLTVLPPLDLPGLTKKQFGLSDSAATLKIQPVAAGAAQQRVAMNFPSEQHVPSVQHTPVSSGVQPPALDAITSSSPGSSSSFEATSPGRPEDLTDQAHLRGAFQSAPISIPGAAGAAQGSAGTLGRGGRSTGRDSGSPHAGDSLPSDEFHDDGVSRPMGGYSLSPPAKASPFLAGHSPNKRRPSGLQLAVNGLDGGNNAFSPNSHISPLGLQSGNQTPQSAGPRPKPGKPHLAQSAHHTHLSHHLHGVTHQSLHSRHSHAHTHGHHAHAHGQHHGQHHGHHPSAAASHHGPAHAGRLASAQRQLSRVQVLPSASFLATSATNGRSVTNARVVVRPRQSAPIAMFSVLRYDSEREKSRSKRTLATNDIRPLSDSDDVVSMSSTEGVVASSNTSSGTSSNIGGAGGVSGAAGHLSAGSSGPIVPMSHRSRLSLPASSGESTLRPANAASLTSPSSTLASAIAAGAAAHPSALHIESRINLSDSKDMLNPSFSTLSLAGLLSPPVGRNSLDAQGASAPTHRQILQQHALDEPAQVGDQHHATQGAQQSEQHLPTASAAAKNEDISYLALLSPSVFVDASSHSVLDVEPYNPRALDDPDLRMGKHKTVLTLPAFMVTIIPYVNRYNLKKDLNEQFRERHPDIDLTFSKMRSLKRQMLEIGVTECGLEVSTVAKAYVFFERLLLKNKISKTNRKAVASVCLLLAAKFHDCNSNAAHPLLIAFDKLLGLSHDDVLSFEFPVYAALEFSLYTRIEDVEPHLSYLIQELDYTEPLYNISADRPVSTTPPDYSTLLD